MANTPLILARQLIQKLAEKGIHSFVVCDESTDGEVVFSVPSLERDGELSQSAVYLLVSEMLEAANGKGLLLTNPATRLPLGVFCYHPNTFMPASDGGDVEFWSGHSGPSFCWTQLEQDSSRWFDGFPMEDGDPSCQRMYFLAALLTATPFELPPYQPAKAPRPAPIHILGIRDVPAPAMTHEVRPDHGHINEQQQV